MGKIASTILSIDDVISKYTDKVSLLEDYKKGLMQQLFPAITK
jgi:type I restriction enzyme S subunit